jgi:hypothetical protein
MRRRCGAHGTVLSLREWRRTQRKPMAYILRRVRGSRRALEPVLAGCAILSTAALLTAPALAAEGKPPIIVSTGWAIGGQVTVEAEINPEGLETSYEIRLECQACGPAGYSPSVGHLPAVKEVRTVSLNLTGIQSGSYWFDVLATNSTGEAFRRGELEVRLAPGIPENKPTPYEPKVEPIADHEAQVSRELTEAERKAREAHEQAEREAKEAQLRLAVERAEREAAEAKAAESKPTVVECVVPSLIGHSRSAAQRALAKAHCKLGKVTKLRGGHGALVVIRQSAEHGKKLPDGARIAIELGATARHEASRRSRRSQ